MAIKSLKNQYRGVNAHLQSLLQTVGSWNSFHANHIADLQRTMQAQLRPMGYVAELETSVQIRRYDQPMGRPESDVAIYDLESPRSQASSNLRLTPSGAAMILSIPEALGLDERTEKQYSAVGIYRADDAKHGTPVAWIELLSPSNKPGGQDAEQYREKRLKLLQSGIVFVEIDYLHMSAPTMPGANDGAAYHLIVIDPRPQFLEGHAQIVSFGVDEPIKTAEIPLNGGDVLNFDFGVPYQKTFAEAFYGDSVDYGEIPLAFNTYNQGDQEHILARMVALMEASRQGKNLEIDPLPEPQLLPLAEALQKLATLQAARSD